MNSPAITLREPSRGRRSSSSWGFWGRQPPLTCLLGSCLTTQISEEPLFLTLLRILPVQAIIIILVSGFGNYRIRWTCC